jgi:Ca2+-binding EF-hand superfamily protein
MKIRLMFLAAIGLAYAGAAMAQTDDAAKPSPENAIKTEIESTFQRIDQDKNGSLSRDEFSAFMEEAISRQVAIFNQTFDTLDLDKDGKISRDEAAENKTFAAGFDDVDTDKDGFVSKQELAMAMKAAQDEQGKK